MPRHNQQNSKFVARFTKQERKTTKVDTVVEVDGTRLKVPGGLQLLPSHWSRVSYRRQLDEMDYNHVRSVDELQDFKASY